MRTAILLAIMLGLCQIANAIIPVKKFPSTIHLPDKIITGATIADCVEAGYRLIPKDKPEAPSGKRIKKEEFVQDETDESACKYRIEYEDIPALPPPPPPPPPEVLVVVPLTNVVFWATSNGVPRSWKLKNAPVTNSMVE